MEKSSIISTEDMMNSIKNMNEKTMMTILVVIIFIIIFSVVYYYYYMSNLSTYECSAIDTLYGSLNGKLRSINDSDPDCKFLLGDYYIKSAYNCCSGGAYVNDFVETCVLKDIIKQGVRCLDFEIYSINDQPVISTSTSDNYHLKDTYNSIPFGKALNIIRDYAFATATCPNSNDPIIVHLRIKSNNKKMYQNFAKLLESYDSILLGKEYSFEFQGKNLGQVPLLNLRKKIIIAVDRINNSFLESNEFCEFINITSNSVFMRALHYYDIQYTPDMNELIEYNKRFMTLGMPDKGSSPPNPSAIVLRETGVQMIAMRYQVFDTNLEENEIYFDLKGYAFALKPEKLRYVPIIIDEPPAQNPENSYATRNISSDFYNFDI
jgi:hypothetical protein